MINGFYAANMSTKNAPSKYQGQIAKTPDE